MSGIVGNGGTSASNPTYGVAASPDGNFAYVATSYGSTSPGSVAVVDTNPAPTGTYNTVIATIPVGLEPFGVAVTPDGKHLYVTNNEGGSLATPSRSAAEASSKWRSARTAPALT